MQEANERGFFSTAFDPDGKSFLRYLGKFRAAYAGYVRDENARQSAASGGVVTSILQYVLEEGHVDGAAVCRADFSKGTLGYEFKIVRDPHEIRRFGSSAYFNIPLERHGPEIAAFDGKLAVCGLPCHTSLMRSRSERPGHPNPPRLWVSLFCGHNNEPELLQFFFRKVGIRENEIQDMKIDRTYLGGSVILKLRGGLQKNLPFRWFNVYRSLGLFTKPMCRYCDDHLGAMSDVSVGDIFIPPYRQRKIKHSAILTRTEQGDQIIQGLIRSGRLVSEKIDPKLIFWAQKRILVPSGDLRSRFHACKRAGYPVRSDRTEGSRFRLRSFLTYFLLLCNDRLSRTRWGERFFRILPRPFLYLYIGAIKVLNHTLKASR